MTRRIKLIERLQELYSEIELLKREIIKETNLEKQKEKQNEKYRRNFNLFSITRYRFNK